MLQSVNPYFTNVIQPVQTIPITTSYQTAHIYNALTPSFVYEPKVAGAVYPNLIPVTGILTRSSHDCEKCCVRGDCKLVNERELNKTIDKKVREQIDRYNTEMVVKAEAAAVAASCCNQCPEIQCSSKVIQEHCLERMNQLSCKEVVLCKKCPYETPRCLNLDQKIQRIREELNLPDEKEQKKLISKLEARKKGNSSQSDCEHELEIIETPRVRRSRSRRSSAESTCERYRTRSKSFEERRSTSRSRSRSRSRGRPLWIPTGANDYTYTNDRRVDMINQQEKRQFMLDSQDVLNRNAVFNKKNNRDSAYFPSIERSRTFCENTDTEKPGNVYAIATFAPIPKTKTKTVESFDYSYNTQKPCQQIIRTKTPEPFNYNTRPKSSVEQSNKTVLRATYAPIPQYQTVDTVKYTYNQQEPPRQPQYYATTAYPLAKEYYYRSPAKNNDLNCYNLRPIQATNGGALYTCSNQNELHYVSDKARRGIQICTSKNDYSKNANNRMRVINSETTVIHD